MRKLVKNIMKVRVIPYVWSIYYMLAGNFIEMTYNDNLINIGAAIMMLLLLEVLLKNWDEMREDCSGIKNFIVRHPIRTEALFGLLTISVALIFKNSSSSFVEYVVAYSLLVSGVAFIVEAIMRRIYVIIRIQENKLFKAHLRAALLDSQKDKETQEE